MVPRFALPPGAYKLTVQTPDGRTREKAVTVADTPVSVKLD